MTGDRRIEEALRRALAAGADAVETAPDALGTIRGRIEGRRARWWLPSLRGPAGLALAGAAAAMVLLAGVAAVAAGWPTHRPGPGPAASATGTAARGTNLPVYYLGPASVADRLYREYHVFPGTGLTPEQAVHAAVQAMLDRPADDPDYRSPWPAGSTVRSVSIEGGSVTVDLSGATGNGRTVDPVATRMAVEQLVWTTTASASGPATVRLLLDGQLPAGLWGVPLAAASLHRGPAADVLAPIWIIDPQQGTVQGRRFPVRLAGIVFEATMRLRVRDEAGVVVDDETVHLDRGAPAQGVATVQLSLPSGRYTIEGYVVSQQDGSDQVYDDHQFTVG